MEHYGYNIVVDNGDNDLHKLLFLKKKAEEMGIEYHADGDFYVYDTTKFNAFVTFIIEHRIGNAVYLYKGLESEDYEWKPLAKINFEF